MKQIEIATALGLSRGQISKLTAKGMPLDSVEAAEAWRRRNVDPGKALGHAAIRKQQTPSPRAHPRGTDGEPRRNPVDIIATTIIPRMFFMLDDWAGDLEKIDDTIRAAGINLDDEQMMRLMLALVERYQRVIDRHMGCCDAPLNLPEQLR